MSGWAGTINVMQECPKCRSQNHRKNGRLQGKQRYRCKDCGRQFLEVEAVSDVSTNSWETSEQGISIILLDLENVKLDRLAENYLQELANYPLQVKLAFANWSETAVNKQDTALYERGYFLVHVPGGKNSADARMMTSGAALRIHYPQVKEVFVCSSDWLLTNLSNELLSQNLRVWRVRRQEKNLEIENRKTGEVYAYSLEFNQEIPDTEQLLAKLEKLIQQQQQSVTEKIQELYQLDVLLNSRKTLLQNKDTFSNNGLTFQDQPSNGRITNPHQQILCADDLENAVLQIIDEIRHQSPNQKITPSTISAGFKKRFGVTANHVVKNLKLGSNITDFLDNSPNLILNDTKNDKVSATVETYNNQITATVSYYSKITNSSQLRKILFELAQSFVQKYGETYIPLTTLGTNFKNHYGESVSTVIKALKFKGNFSKFIQSCEEFQVTKVGNVYRITPIENNY